MTPTGRRLTIADVPAVAFAAPLRHGQTESVRDVLASCWFGAAKEGFHDATRRAGITREAIWIQTTADGDVAVVYMEADDLAVAIQLLQASPEPFDRWFRAEVVAALSITLDVAFQRAELVLELDAERP